MVMIRNGALSYTRLRDKGQGAVSPMEPRSGWTFNSLCAFILGPDSGPDVSVLRAQIQYIVQNGYIYMYIYWSPCISMGLKLKGHIHMRILLAMVFGSPLVLGLGTRM